MLLLENGKLDIKAIEKLNEEDLNKEQESWGSKQWVEYFQRNGTFTLDEVEEIAMNIIKEKMIKKYGHIIE